MLPKSDGKGTRFPSSGIFLLVLLPVTWWEYRVNVLVPKSLVTSFSCEFTAFVVSIDGGDY